MPEDNTTETQGWRVASRFMPQRLRALAAAGRLRVAKRFTLLAPEDIQALARQSFWLLVASGIGFVLLDLAARLVRPTGELFGTLPVILGLLLLVVANIVAYVVILPIHEGLHAAVILVLGGSPSFGVKMPFAIYCTARGQLFSKVGYIAVALAPFVVLTVVGIVVTCVWPNVGAYLWLAWVGNVSGAVGDLVSVGELRRQHGEVLIADTGDGFDVLVPDEGAA
jgi:hypothetical protein